MDVRFLIDMIITLVGLSFFIPAYDLSKDSKAQCGFPGSPKYGSVTPNNDLYEENDIVTYDCYPGFMLLGKSVRRCRKNGTWTEDIPLCDVSMTSLGTATSSPVGSGYATDFVIDRQKNTCTFLKPQPLTQKRWLEVDLGDEYEVLSVAISRNDLTTEVNLAVYVLSIKGSTTVYTECATFNGKFGSRTVLLSCARGKDVKGSKVYLDDKMPSTGFFEICEVEVQVEKDEESECGEPDRNPYSVTNFIENGNELDEVHYSCQMGYRREGAEVRICMRNGQWDGIPPTCEEIECESLDPLENGELQLSVINGDKPLQGAIANYICDSGYKLIGSFSRICLDNGTWSGTKPKCEDIRCNIPDGRDHGGVFRLLNTTTRMGSVAVLKCKKGKPVGDNPFIYCNEEGDWTEPNARCSIIPVRVDGSSKKDRGAGIVEASVTEASPTIKNKGAVIFGMVIAGIMITVVFVSIYVVMQRRRNGNKPELPSRQIEAPEAPPRPPPRSKGSSIFYVQHNFMSRKDSPKEDKDSAWKTRSLPMNQDEQKEAWPAALNAVRASSFNQQLEKPEPTSRTASPQTEENVSPEDQQAGSDEAESEIASKERSTTASPDIPKEKTDKTSSPNKAPAREYAAVDYEKKRQSRLLKGQSSEDSETERIRTPTPIEENKDLTPPVVPPKDMGKEGSKKPTTDEEKKAVGDELQPVTDDEAKPAVSSKRTRAEPEPNDKVKPAISSRRTRTEPEPEPEPEDKTKRTKRTRAQVETPEPAPDTGRRTRRTRGRTEDEG